ncbi:MAG: hypothetical protein AAF658_09575 [Myxococcota bacterium]
MSSHGTGVVELLQRVLAREPFFAAVVGVLLLLMVPTGIARLVDTRTIDGLNVWVKPLKFEVSLAVFCATLVIFANLLPAGTTESRAYRLYAWSVAIAIAAEMLWLLVAAGMGIRSHFNSAQPLFRAVYPMMGVVAVYLTSVTLVYGVLILMGKPGPFGAAVGVGFMLTFLLTTLVASALATTDAALGGTPNGPGAPIFGWRSITRDLRAAHFVATHAVLFIALPAWWAQRFLSRTSSYVASGIAAALVTLLVLGLFVNVTRAPRESSAPSPVES